MKPEFITKTFSHMPVLQTERLILRRMSVADAEDMFAYAQMPQVSQYLTWSPHADVCFTYNYLRRVEAQYHRGEFYDWAVVDCLDGRMIGTCGFTSFRAASDVGEVGYVLHPAYWGRGYATEAVRTVLAFGFEKLGLHRIEARFLEGNHASRRVMEKVGMQFEGWQREAILIKGTYCTLGICALLRQEYENFFR